MSSVRITIPKEKGLISTNVLLLISFSTVFFPRLIDAAGAPSTINFAHFLVVPCCFLIGISGAHTISKAQAGIIRSLLTLIFVLLIIEVASALINSAGAINAVLSFLLLAEPLIFLISLLSVNSTHTKFEIFRSWIIRFSVFHILLALLQWILLNIGLMQVGELGVIQDNIQGVFYLSGGGHVVAATISMYFGIYYYISARTYEKAYSSRIVISTLILAAAFLQLLVADAKQVMLVLLVAWGLLALTKFKDMRAFLKNVVLIALFLTVFIWCMNNLTLFRAFGIWLRPDIYGSDGVATQLKFASFRIISEYTTSPLNWLFGLGPGHTVGRLGGWMLPKYQDLLVPLGATIHPASDRVWSAVWNTWIGSQSSMFSPLFGWAGIWGDLGALGLATYVSIGVTIWKKLCRDDFSRFVLLTMIVHGCIFSQLEEPGFMIYSATLVFLRWRETQANNGYSKFSRS